jgi:hypothetical protein
MKFKKRKIISFLFNKNKIKKNKKQLKINGENIRKNKLFVIITKFLEIKSTIFLVFTKQ